MIRLALLLLMAFSGPLVAQPVAVTSGEHDGFTRLVFDFGRPVDWQVGRSQDGYVMRLNGETPRYDLTQAFRLIGKSRLAAIWADPADGTLRLGLACACHALPFEFRPGIIVVDLRDGPPPKGSSFELGLDGRLSEPLAQRPQPRPRPRPALPPPGGYDWQELALGRLRPGGDVPPPPATVVRRPDVLPPDPALDPLRAALLQQMARGAAQGVVDMTVRPAPGPAAPPFSQARVRIGDSPEVRHQPESAARGDLSADGRACPSTTEVDAAAWGDLTRPAADQLAEARAALTGEFDRVDPATLQKAVRLHLHLGFGAEARQLITALSESPGQLAREAALGHLVDLEQDPTGIFDGLWACDGPAALWAVLATPPQRGDAVNAAAVRLAFSALPLHLRHHLGPRLVDRFLAIDDRATAQALRDAVGRAPGALSADLSLISARIDLHGDRPAEAEARATAALSQPGPGTTDALLALVEARVAQRLPVKPDLVLALQAALAQEGTTDPRLTRGLGLAQAAAGQFDEAAATLGESLAGDADFWALLAALAPDDALLRHGVRAADDRRPVAPAAAAHQIAERLLGLGLAPAAADWALWSGETDALLAARIALARGDATAALGLLGSDTGEEAEALRLVALARSGQNAALARRASAAQDTDETRRALALAGDWQGIAALPPEAAGPWHGLAVAAGGATDTALPSLERAEAIVTAAEATRKAALALTAEVPPP